MEANKENQQSMEQAFNQALDAYKAGNFAGSGRSVAGSCRGRLRTGAACARLAV